ncbi:MAG: hypothetical protein MUW56_04040 [Chryseobacterium sp.]|uniref:hypothetical protein n=1 Tax=Chryseobacterium sp. TaxID=1871047 RepID=UPI0025BA803E|nr:hypothetical protein [Chryseobacterium sp.]MCJ7932806.1 hypothetical protein [Chryseobacterium sp.]
MSTTVSFFNSNKKQITEQQAFSLNNFSKHIHINNVLKKEETYRDNNLWGGRYYLSPGEDVIQVLTALDPSLNWTILSNKQIINNYTVWDCKFYTDLQQDATYSRIVLNSGGNKIATITYDSITHEAKGGLKVFNYGNKHIPWGDPDDVFFEDSEIYFSFYDNGDIRTIFMNYDLFSNDSFWDSLDVFLKDAGDFFQKLGITNEQLYYFTHVEPLVPNF